MHKQGLPYLTVKQSNLHVCAATTNTGEMTRVGSCDYMILAVLYQSMGFSLFHDCSNCFISSVFCLSKKVRRKELHRHLISSLKEFILLEKMSPLRNVFSNMVQKKLSLNETLQSPR
jgi:hypothetical protein